MKKMINLVIVCHLCVHSTHTHTLSALQLERKVKRTDFVCTFFVINLQLEIRPAENEKLHFGRSVESTKRKMKYSND